jgi:hypothetical protein
MGMGSGVCESEGGPLWTFGAGGGVDLPPTDPPLPLLLSPSQWPCTFWASPLPKTVPIIVAALAIGADLVSSITPSLYSPAWHNIRVISYASDGSLLLVAGVLQMMSSQATLQMRL